MKVKLIVSDWVVGGRGEADLRALAATPNIEVRISQVADWSKGYIPFARVEHCKYMVTDGQWLWLSGRFDDVVYRISTSTGAVDKIKVGQEPHGLTVWPQPGRYSLGHTGILR